MEILNKEQADILFQREAALFGSVDAVPCFRAAALFGADAVEHAGRMGFKNGYGVRDYTLGYISYRGFLAAASYSNVQQLRTEADAWAEMSVRNDTQKGNQA